MLGVKPDSKLARLIMYLKMREINTRLHKDILASKWSPLSSFISAEMDVKDLFVLMGDKDCVLVS